MRDTSRSTSRQSRDLAQLYLDIVDVIVLSIDCDGKIRLANRKACEILGRDEADLIGADWFTLAIPAAERDEIRAVFDSLIAGEEAPVERFENAVVTAAGERRVIAWHNRVLRDDQDRIVQILASGEDVTAQRRAETSAQVSEGRLRSIYEAVQVGVLIQDRSGEIVHTNRIAAEILQMNPDGILRLTSDDPVWKMIDETGRLLSGAEHPSMITLRTGCPVRNVVRGLYSGDGSRTRWLLINTVPMCTEGEEVCEVLVTFSDITEQKRVEETLRRSEQQLHLALDSASEGFWEWSHATGLIYLDQGARNIVGGDDADASITPYQLLDLIHDDDRRDVEAAVNGFLTQPDTSGGPEFRLVQVDGTWRWLSTSATVVERNGNGQPTLVTGICRDVTARKQAEEERQQFDNRVQHAQKLESLGVLAGGIAHDFANILLAILGNNSLAQEDLPETSPVRPYLEQVEASARHASDLCRQMLAYSGRGRILVAPVDLNRVVREMGRILAVTVAKKVSLRYDLAAMPPIVEGDSSQLGQVVMNLISNASDAIGDREGAVTVRTGVRACTDRDWRAAYYDDGLPSGDYATIEVKDTGMGMDEETRQRMFDPFYSTKFTGRGLGLAAVLGIVRGHYGTIVVNSTPDSGTSVVVYLPLSKTAVAPKPTLRDKPRPGVSTTVGTVLFVDDERAIRDLGERTLMREGHTMLVAADGQEALSLFTARAAAIDLVILDLTMPRLDGVQTFHALRKLRSDVPVVLSSGYTTEEVCGRFGEDRPAAFIQKPYQPRDLVEVVQDILG